MVAFIAYELIFDFFVIVHFITSRKGSQLLFLEGHTFSKNARIRHGGIRYACSRMQSKKCKAFVHVAANNAIIKAEIEHNHAPPKLFLTEHGYIKID